MSGRVRIYKAIKDDGTALWPEVRPIEYLQELKRSMPGPFFNAQYQNDPSGLRGVRYDMTWIQYYMRGQRPPLWQLQIIQGGDPATSEDESSNYFGHCTAGRDPHTGVIYILGFDFDHIPATRHMSYLRAQRSAWEAQGSQVSKVRYESHGPIQAASQHLELANRMNDTDPLPLEIIKPMGTKEQRFDELLPHLGAGTILFPGEMQSTGVELVETRGMSEFKSEWTTFPKGRRDDVLDALWIVVDGLLGVPMAAAITSSTLNREQYSLNDKAHRMSQDEFVKLYTTSPHVDNSKPTRPEVDHREQVLGRQPRNTDRRSLYHRRRF